MEPPDLTDPGARAAYRSELRGVYRGWRILGLAIVVVGAGRILWLGEGFDSLTVALLAIGWAILIAVMVARTRYHRRRMVAPKE